MSDLKYKAESILRELKAVLEDAVKFEEENAKLKRQIEDQQKQFEKERAELTKQK